ncbi:UDP-N-acetylmuramoyl-L-alanyl-D-glutamate--2,6-diaminopimelate ligase [Tenggerimyces flavus]|uniref:UDP-N-acetylmuramoyl-L-alanyl-D-glutamate--2,6-diaminopimelate ligase n=1 Tax=Tenggerimyces flavus TaxID=1708749 RepID=A0ABV7Y3M1_9ACTN|nr:UDP-N-acetylmuramoyl-L-alanyl-D-glutamate--2,6-diaminopimelate ligase [Tenggerimyces flavus]MBM7788590.1 UDP-N-acetylmuramoyl-L-alanyl-D-glutamate--2,6-diaminopimelate ligase [Tenggerimyces flavus]
MAAPAHRPTTHQPRRLSEAAAFLGVAAPAEDPELTGIAQDSRRAQPGDLYVARPGEFAHGAQFADKARANGAVAALTDEAGQEDCVRAGLPTLVVGDPRQLLGTISAWVYGDPADALTLLGITGTNGKTTTSYLVDAALRAAGNGTGLIGTIETRIGDDVEVSARTTPEAPDLHALFAVMRERGVTAATMEVSSHALTLGRVDGVRFDVAGFTNLSQDHLEIHGDMESYYAAKASLFGKDRAQLGVVNVDDAAGALLAAEAEIEIVTVSPSGDPAANWRASDVALEPTGVAFDVHGPDDTRLRVSLGIPGEFNVANGLVAVAMLHAVGIDGAAIVRGLATATVPGRMERIQAGQAFTAIVDYAHTPDAIERVLATVRPLTEGRVIAVVGCGGDRDQSKRPLMGAAAANGADVAVITDDNPRSEDPAAIRAAAIAGAKGRAEVVEIGGRREAIGWALDTARQGDTVVVLGKGHELGQEIAGIVHPFDDRQVVLEQLRRMEERS